MFIGHLLEIMAMSVDLFISTPIRKRWLQTTAVDYNSIFGSFDLI